MKKTDNDTEFLRQFGKRVQDYRHELMLSQTELAKRVGSESSNDQRSYISKLEAGQRNPAITMVIRLSDALHVTVSELVGENDNPFLEKFSRLSSENQKSILLMIDSMLSVQNQLQ